MKIIEKAKKLRKKIEELAETMDDAESLDFPSLFANWHTDTDYTTDTRVRYNDVLYKCLQAHTSQDSWTPDTAVSLWVRVDDPAVEWPDWVQPTGSTDAYSQGAKVSHNGSHWISDLDGNVWEPGIYGWTAAL